MSQPDIQPKSRLLTLDYLRGFFIVVIIVDHLSRWPSLLEFISGRALLWVTAAEGFVAISGLLVGYIRGFKNKALSMKAVTIKLLRRAGLLYVWSIIATIAYTAIIWYVPFIGGTPGMLIEKGEWLELLFKTVTLEHAFVWIHFLTLYALFLAAAPLAVWLLRRGLAWLVITLSFGVLVLGWITHIEALQWQILFFVPAVAGYYLSSIMKWWQGISQRTRVILTTLTIGMTVLTIALSALCIYNPGVIQTTANTLNGLFEKDTISFWRTLLALTWFTGFVLLFQLLHKPIGRLFGWLLLPFGTRSLTAYILHGVAICIISFFTMASTSIFINTILGSICILIVWGLLKVPFVQKLLPS